MVGVPGHSVILKMPSMVGGCAAQTIDGLGMGVLVGVSVGVSVGANVGVNVGNGVLVGVPVGAGVDVTVGMGVQVCVAVGPGVSVGAGVGEMAATEAVGVRVGRLATRGSVPCVTSRPSSNPSPSVSRFIGLVL